VKGKRGRGRGKKEGENRGAGEHNTDELVYPTHYHSQGGREGKRIGRGRKGLSRHLIARIGVSFILLKKRREKERGGADVAVNHSITQKKGGGERKKRERRNQLVAIQPPLQKD